MGGWKILKSSLVLHDKDMVTSVIYTEQSNTSLVLQKEELVMPSGDLEFFSPEHSNASSNNPVNFAYLEYIYCLACFSEK